MMTMRYMVKENKDGLLGNRYLDYKDQSNQCIERDD